MSIGKVAEGLMGRRAKTLFHIIILFLIALAMGVFVDVIALLFTPAFYPEAVAPSAALIGIALAMGVVIYRRGWPIAPVTALGFFAMIAFLWAGMENPIVGLSHGQWKWLLLLYAFAASVLPVWLLLQPRDWINSLLLFLGVGGMYLGFFVTQPSFAAPAIETHPEGAPPMFPYIFVIIACGAVSGFHSLVSSGTSAKQLDRESDAPLVGYGSMIGESLLGLLAVLACTAGFLSREDWLTHYASWQTMEGLGPSIGAFVSGTSQFLSGLGFPKDGAGTFVAVLIVSFALTSLDSATRLLRYNLSEMAETVRLSAFGNRYIASTLAVAAIWFFAFFEVDGRSAGLVLWQLFGTTNQLLGALALLAITLYLLQRRKPIRYTLLPMLFLLVATLTAMATNLVKFWQQGLFGLLLTGGAVFGLAVWLTIEAALAVRRYRREPPVETLDVEFRY
jgi:carbon starvation protein